MRMTPSDRVRQLRVDHPDWSMRQLAETADVALGTAYRALENGGLSQPRRPTGAQMLARKFRTMHPDWSLEEIARRVRLPLRQVRVLLEGYEARTRVSKAVRPVGHARRCVDCSTGAAKIGSDRCAICGPIHEKRERAVEFARRGVALPASYLEAGS